MAPRLSQAPVSAPSHQWSITDTPATFGVTARHHCAICESITVHPPRPHPQSGSAGMLPRLFRCCTCQLLADRGSRSLRSSCHFRCSCLRLEPLGQGGLPSAPLDSSGRVRKPGPQPSSRPVLAGGTTPGERAHVNSPWAWIPVDFEASGSERPSFIPNSTIN